MGEGARIEGADAPLARAEEGPGDERVRIRPATSRDLPEISALLAVYVRLRLVRSRSLEELRGERGNFFVAERGGEVVGCVSLRVYGPGLAEVASLAVAAGNQGFGIGRRLVQHGVLRAHARGVRRVFAFTTREGLFLQLGFRKVPVTDFPQKLVRDYGGMAIATGRKVAVVFDLEQPHFDDTPARRRNGTHHERDAAPFRQTIHLPRMAAGPNRTTANDDTPNHSTPGMAQKMTETTSGARRIAILGGGNLGRALAMGWVEAGYTTADRIRITRRNPDKLTFFADAGFQVGSDNREAVEEADVVILAVQPQQIESLAEEIRGSIDPERHRIISVASGVSIRQLRELLDTRASIIRAMPNTAVSIGESMTCIASSESGDPALAEAMELFDVVGRTLVIHEEMMIPATALCACGVAFFLRSIRAASQGGIEIGFDPEEALLLAAQTAKGAAMLLLDQGRHPESEIDRVTTPRGCTIAGLNEMEHQGFSSALIKGILLSAQKAEGLYAE